MSNPRFRSNADTRRKIRNLRTDIAGIAGVAQTLNNIGLLLQSTGDLAGAERELRRSIAMLRKTAGDGHPLVAQGQSNLDTLACQRRGVAAGTARDRALEQCRATAVSASGNGAPPR